MNVSWPIWFFQLTWMFMYNQTGLFNIKYPDSHASYYGTFFYPNDTNSLHIYGTVPNARYISYSVYDTNTLNTLTYINDTQINYHTDTIKPSTTVKYHIEIKSNTSSINNTHSKNKLIQNIISNSSVLIIYRIYDEISYSPLPGMIIQNTKHVHIMPTPTYNREKMITCNNTTPLFNSIYKNNFFKPTINEQLANLDSEYLLAAFEFNETNPHPHVLKVTFRPPNVTNHTLFYDYQNFYVRYASISSVVQSPPEPVLAGDQYTNNIFVSFMNQSTIKTEDLNQQNDLADVYMVIDKQALATLNQSISGPINWIAWPRDENNVLYSYPGIILRYLSSQSQFNYSIKNIPVNKDGYASPNQCQEYMKDYYPIIEDITSTLYF